jgi:hypothetical protein
MHSRRISENNELYRRNGNVSAKAANSVVTHGFTFQHWLFPFLPALSTRSPMASPAASPVFAAGYTWASPTAMHLEDSDDAASVQGWYV